MFVALFPIGAILVIIGEALRTNAVQATVTYKGSFVVPLFNAGGIALMSVGVLVMAASLLSMMM